MALLQVSSISYYLCHYMNIADYCVHIQAAVTVSLIALNQLERILHSHSATLHSLKLTHPTLAVHVGVVLLALLLLQLHWRSLHQ
jgi:hypothetical protein